MTEENAAPDYIHGSIELSHMTSIVTEGSLGKTE